MFILPFGEIDRLGPCGRTSNRTLLNESAL
jgi:hypothetical protein